MRRPTRLGFSFLLPAVAAAGCGDMSSNQPGVRGEQPEVGVTQEVTPATSGDKVDLQPYVDRELVVKFKPKAAAVAAADAHRALDAEVVRSFRNLRDLEVVRLPEGADVRAAAAAYGKLPDVEYAEPNYIWQPMAIPDDPAFGELWGLDNTGQTGGTGDADINGPEAWELTTGSADTVIAVIDTGIDYDHEDLAANVWTNPGEIPGNGIDDDDNGYVDDVHGINTLTNTGDPFDDVGHGTHVSGTIAAVGDNETGVAGVNWDAQILSCKFLGAAGGTTEGAIACLDYLVELKTRSDNPVNIVASNNSWGGGGFSEALRDAIDQTRNAGMLFVAAAGNDGLDTDVTPTYPQAYDLPNIISVAAIDHDDELASFSNFGRSTVDVTAPGVAVLSTTPGDTYDLFSGTSMAAPHVTGLIGLLKSQDTSRDWIALRNLVLTGGVPTDSAADTTLTGRRIRAADEGGFGSLTCEDQPLVRRMQPAGDVVSVSIGETIPLSVLSVNCAQADDEGASVLVEETGEELQLVDDGGGADGAAGDGIFSASWTIPGEGPFHLTFGNGETVVVNVVQNYGEPRLVAKDYREIEGTRLNLGDDTSELVESPFEIEFAGASGLSEFYVGSNGTISFESTGTPFFNGALPTTSFDTLVAPFWDDLSPNLTSGDAGVFVDVIGEEGERELVVEWRDVPHFSCRQDGVTLQVVFAEGDSSVLFQYDDVDFGDPACDAGVQATVGLQVAPGIAQQFSFGEPVLDGDTAILWQLFGAPVPSTGGDQVVLPGAEVELDGSASTDPNGDIVAFEWTQTGGTPVDLAGAGTAVASFVAPEDSETLTFELTVTDDEGNTGVASVDVTVNLAPVADAGPDLVAGAYSPVVLDATASSDADGEVVGYQWTQLDGAPVELIDSGTAIAQFTAPVVTGILIFQLEVTDDLGFTSIDHLAVTVEGNELPVAEAGPGQIVRTGAAVTLDGSGSRDPDGAIEGYAWEQVSGAPVELTGADTASPTFVAPAENGLLEFQLTVTDGSGATATDTVEIAVFNQNPVADAGSDQVVSPGAAVTLDGSGSVDPDGSVAAYEWEQVAGPTVELTGADAAVAEFSAPSESGTLAFLLTVTDGDGLTGFDIVHIAVNRAPIADTGGDRHGNAGDTIVLDGSDSRDDDGEIVSYEWVQVSGSPVALTGADTAAASFTAPAPDGFTETFVFELTVTDDHGVTATDRSEVLVLPAGASVAEL